MPKRLNNHVPRSHRTFRMVHPSEGRIFEVLRMSQNILADSVEERILRCASLAKLSRDVQRRRSEKILENLSGEN